MSIISQNPRVTIIITARERYGLTEATLNSILQNTEQPYRLIYADVQSPAWLQNRLAFYSQHHAVEVIRFDEPLWPQQVRKRLAPLIDTDYVVYIDNDVLVEPQWLTHLVNCADETNAGIVGPLYLWRKHNKATTIHMAGGKLIKEVTADGLILNDKHDLFDVDPLTVPEQLIRKPSDFAEFHCMLIRATLIHDDTFLDDAIYCVHEHIDIALSANKRGHSIYLEPLAKVYYQAFEAYQLNDLPFFRSRWDINAGEASLSAFSKKWEVINDNRSFAEVRAFLYKHINRVDPIRGFNINSLNFQIPMESYELKQTRSDLLDFAVTCNYVPIDIELLGKAYQIAQRLFDGAYRPCGRPFINHLVGTASVLMRYGFRANTVAAGLLHSAYSHCPHHNVITTSTLDEVRQSIGGKGSLLDQKILAYTQRSTNLEVPLDQSTLAATLMVFDAEILAITAANEVDMHLSGEIRYSGRTDSISNSMQLLISYACQILGIPGLQQSVSNVIQASSTKADVFMTNIKYSYRLSQDKKKAIPMQITKIS